VRLQKLYNPIVAGILRSPLHAAMSNSTMLLTFSGRKSGRTYTTPVNYVCDGDELFVVGSRGHSWWKNLRGDAVVSVRVRGREMRGEADAFEGEAAEEGLLAVLRAVPAYRRYWKVELGEDDRPQEPDALRRVARDNALVRIRKLEPA
jgi:deazaflavin-dependent oxidoreductase (nitroreductase family)